MSLASKHSSNSSSSWRPASRADLPIFALSIKTLTGMTFQLQMSCTPQTQTLEGLKQIIQVNAGVPVANQIIVHKGLVLEDDNQTLDKCGNGIKDNDFVVVALATNPKPAKQSVAKPSHKKTAVKRQNSLGPSRARMPMRKRAKLGSRADAPFSFEFRDGERFDMIDSASDEDDDDDDAAALASLEAMRRSRRRRAEAVVASEPPASMSEMMAALRRRPRAAPQGDPLHASPDKIAQLTTMGFGEFAAKRALAMNSNNTELSLNWLLEHCGDANLNKELTDAEKQEIMRMHELRGEDPIRRMMQIMERRGPEGSGGDGLQQLMGQLGVPPPPSMDDDL